MSIERLHSIGADGPEAEPDDCIAAAAGGDVDAFAHLYRRYAARVHGLCFRLCGQRETAEDCTQETFVAAWRALPRFEARSGFSTWLHRIAVRTVTATRRGLRVAYEVPAIDGAAERLEGSPEGMPLDLEHAIARLPAGARHVLVLVGIYGYSHAEASQMLDIAAGTSKAQLHRAKRLLSVSMGLEDT